jgi:hypothetical protein
LREIRFAEEKRMETTVRATFKRRLDMQKAAAALKRQGAIDVRLDGEAGSTLPDDVEFAADGLESAVGNGTCELQALWVSVEKSRYRQAEDTIAACGGMIDAAPVNIFE